MKPILIALLLVTSLHAGPTNSPPKEADAPKFYGSPRPPKRPDHPAHPHGAPPGLVKDPRQGPANPSKPPKPPKPSKPAKPGKTKPHEP